MAERVNKQRLTTNYKTSQKTTEPNTVVGTANGCKRTQNWNLLPNMDELPNRNDQLLYRRKMFLENNWILLASNN